MICVHLQSPWENFITLQFDQSHYISQTVPQKNFLIQQYYCFLCILVTVWKVLMLPDTIKVSKYDPCPSTKPMGQGQTNFISVFGCFVARHVPFLNKSHTTSIEINF